jgi:type I restriction enzyme, S subunit
MAVFSIIKLSELEGAKRLDAEFYDPYYFDLEKKIKRKKWDYLGNLLVFNRRGIQPKYSDIPTKYRAVVSQNILEDFLDVDNLPFVEENFFNSKQAQAIKIQPFDILIYTTGANIGRTNIFYPKKIDAIASNHVNIIRADKSKINQLYLGVFLQSRIGRKWTDRWASGSDQEEIYPEDFERFPVLIADDDIQNEVANLVLQSFEFIESSNKLYSQAENFLLEELGLKDFKPKYEKTYTSKLSDVFSAHRIDAEYFQPAYEEVIKLLMKKVKVEKLKNVVSFISHGKQPYYVENGDVPVLIQKHLGSQLLSLYSEIVNMPDTPRTDREFVKNYPEYLIKPFDVLFYSVGAYLGRANVVLENFEAVPASFITLIRTKQEICNPVYLALFLNSDIGQLQSSRWESASAQQYIYPKEIKEFIIPLLPLSTQQEIASLVKQSHEARKEAKELLEVAKKAVEIAIEEGEEKAKIYLLNHRIKNEFI